MGDAANLRGRLDLALAQHLRGERLGPEDALCRVLGADGLLVGLQGLQQRRDGAVALGPEGVGQGPEGPVTRLEGLRVRLLQVHGRGVPQLGGMGLESALATGHKQVNVLVVCRVHTAHREAQMHQLGSEDGAQEGEKILTSICNTFWVSKRTLRHLLLGQLCLAHVLRGKGTPDVGARAPTGRLHDGQPLECVAEGALVEQARASSAHGAPEERRGLLPRQAPVLGLALPLGAVSPEGGVAQDNGQIPLQRLLPQLRAHLRRGAPSRAAAAEHVVELDVLGDDLWDAVRRLRLRLALLLTSCGGGGGGSGSAGGAEERGLGRCGHDVLLSAHLLLRHRRPPPLLARAAARGLPGCHFRRGCHRGGPQRRLEGRLRRRRRHGRRVSAAALLEADLPRRRARRRSGRRGAARLLEQSWRRGPERSPAAGQRQHRGLWLRPAALRRGLDGRA
mmetsp:Transcript_106830/g.341241  ORF Transcript_106830/g.341241 Transcript_106830/m.341241 type:complete len:450 (-) Transcript_106830:312-1661(-)